MRSRDLGWLFGWRRLGFGVRVAAGQELDPLFGHRFVGSAATLRKVAVCVVLGPIRSSTEQPKAALCQVD